MLALTGLFIGFVGGMVGLVLGVIRYPIILDIETSVSVTAGTNLGISTLGSITSSIKDYRQNNIDFQVFIMIAVTGAIASFVGSFLTNYVPTVFLLAIIGIIVSYESFSLIKNSNKLKIKFKHEHQDNEVDINNHINKPVIHNSKLLIAECIIGFAVGLLGGLEGIVLGSIRMPAMISILKLKPRIAVGTNLACASIMGITGLVGHILNNNIDYIILLIMGLGAMIGAYLGAKYTNKFSDSSLKFLIGLVLIVVAISLFVKVLIML